MRFNVRPAAVGVASVLLLSLCVSPALAGPVGSAGVAAGTKGSDGVGDPYFPLDGNGGYDVVHYDIADSYDVASDDLSGTTTITAKATKKLTRFDLDLVLTVDGVAVNGKPAKYTTQPHELVVTPKAAIADGSTFSVEVSYRGKPGSVSYGGERPWISDGREALATNEPHIAPWWFATNDHPTDHATYDITITAPRGQQVISNGILVSKKAAGKTKSWHWRMETPIASYLAFFAVGKYAVRTGSADGMPYTIAASKNLPDPQGSLDYLENTPAVVDWLSSQFGPYPYTSTGGLVTGTGRGFSLENASRPTYSAYAGMSTMVHELAHQWFGDGITVRRWSDIWLNEGFASYAQWLYSETHGGRSTFDELLSTYDAIGAGDSFWLLPIGDPGAGSMFDDPVYTRGAMTLAALRHRIGDSDFHTLMRTWVAEEVGGSGSISRFEKLAGSVSGEDLAGFFEAWLVTGAKPDKTKSNGLV